MMCRFVVIADDPIKKDTFITEYIGEVDILERNEQNSNDSIMDLVHNTYFLLDWFHGSGTLKQAW